MSAPHEGQKEISCCAPPSIGIEMKRNPMKMQSKSRTLVVFTLGDSTRRLDEFVAVLRALGVRRGIDIRTVPNHGTIRNSTVKLSVPICGPAGLRMSTW
jgi:hypothetical protein